MKNKRTKKQETHLRIIGIAIVTILVVPHYISTTRFAALAPIAQLCISTFWVVIAAFKIKDYIQKFIKDGEKHDREKARN